MLYYQNNENGRAEHLEMCKNNTVCMWFTVELTKDLGVQSKELMYCYRILFIKQNKKAE